MEKTHAIWLAVGIFAAILLIAGFIHLAFRTSAQLYLQMRETDEKQTKHIFDLEKHVAEIERKLSLFEANLKYEAQRK